MYIATGRLVEQTGLRSDGLLPLVGACLVSLGLCAGHATGSTALVAAFLACFSALVLLSPMSAFLPLMLFFLPWSLVVRASASTFSFCTIVVPLFAIRMVVELKERLRLPIVPLVCAGIVMTSSLWAKLLDGTPSVSTSYLMFVFLLFFTPLYIANVGASVSYRHCVSYFAVGVILSCVLSLLLADNQNMREFITIASTDVPDASRACGFVGDGNGFAAQVLAALGGVLSLQLSGRARVGHLLMALALFACGIVTVSKMFILLGAVMAVFWVVGLTLEPGSALRNIVLFGLLAAVIALAFLGGLFDYQIDIYVRRFDLASVSLSSLTTLRSDIWAEYLRQIFSDGSLILFGDGFGRSYLFVEAASRAASPHSTPIELVFRLGLVGLVACVIWIVSIIRLALGGAAERKGALGATIVLLLGCFGSWMALAMLTFDDFFYVSAFFAIGYSFLRRGESGQPRPLATEGGDRVPLSDEMASNE